ncbi:hypothetical protein D3C81_1907320 [compost metagenome]
MCPQVFGGTNARKHQELGGYQRTGAENHFFTSSDESLVARFTDQCDTHCPLIFNQQASHFAVGAHNQIGPTQGWTKVAASGAASFAVLAGGLVITDTRLGRTVEVVIVVNRDSGRFARFLGRLNEGLAEDVSMAAIRHR